MDAIHREGLKSTIRVKEVVADLGLKNKVVGELALHKKSKARCVSND